LEQAQTDRYTCLETTVEEFCFEPVITFSLVRYSWSAAALPYLFLATPRTSI